MPQSDFEGEMNHKNTGLLAPNGARARVSTFVLRYLWPSPPGRGCPDPALSPAGAGRVRGLLLSLANQPLPPGLGRPSLCKAIVLRTPVLQGRLLADLYLQPPVAQRGRRRVLSFGLVAPQGAAARAEGEYN